MNLSTQYLLATRCLESESEDYNLLMNGTVYTSLELANEARASWACDLPSDTYIAIVELKGRQLSFVDDLVAGYKEL